MGFSEDLQRKKTDFNYWLKKQIADVNQLTPEEVSYHHGCWLQKVQKGYIK